MEVVRGISIIILYENGETNEGGTNPLIKLKYLMKHEKMKQFSWEQAAI